MIRDFPQLLTMSQREAEAFEPQPGDICISITSGFGEPVADLKPGFDGVLRLEFCDVGITGDVRHADGMQWRHAHKVIEFVEAHPEAKRLLVHCMVGASRSVSLALALSDYYGDGKWRPRHWPEMVARGEIKDDFIPNRNVYDTVASAIEAVKRRAVRGGPSVGV